MTRHRTTPMKSITTMQLFRICLCFILLAVPFSAATATTTTTATHTTSTATARHPSVLPSPSITYTDVSCTQGSWQLLETIPPDLKLSLVPGASTHYEAFQEVLVGATHDASVAALYVELSLESWNENEPNAWHGPALNKTFYTLAKQRQPSVNLSMITNNCELPHAMFSCKDAENLMQNHVFDIALANWSTLVAPGWGVQHAKILTVDGVHAYSGSANMAWSSFAQTKELGLMLRNCPRMVNEYQKPLDMWTLATHLNKIPDAWPEAMLPSFNYTHHALVSIPNSAGVLEKLDMFPCYSPPPFHYGPGADCANVLTRLIGDATSTISIALMDYSPTTLYQKHGGYPEQYWDVLDQALRHAAFDGVSVRLLVSNWSMTFPTEQPYWRSLDQLEHVQVRQFRMPATNFTEALRRVNHCKFMVTDEIGYVGTSNWSGDYFLKFGGLGWTIKGGSVRETLLKAFERDWASPFAVGLYY
jgi:phospholipase D3/4